MKIHILKSPYSVLMDPEKNAAVIQDIGKTLRDSGTLFNIKPRAELENQKLFFTIDNILNPKSKTVFETWFGDRAGWEKRPASRELNPDEPKDGPEKKSADGSEGK